MAPSLRSRDDSNEALRWQLCDTPCIGVAWGDCVAGKMERMKRLNSPLPVSGCVVRKVVAALALLFLAPLSAWAACGNAPAAGVDWSGCEKARLILRKAELQGAKLDGATLNGSDLAQANLAGADLTRAGLERVRLTGADLDRAKLVRLMGYRTNFSGSKLVGADLTKAELMRSNFSAANLAGANFEKAEMQRAQLDGAVLTGANLSGADLARANMGKAKFGGARLEQARMFLTRIEGVDLSAALGMSQSQLDSACGDSQTKLPKGLKAPASWPCPKED